MNKIYLTLLLSLILSCQTNTNDVSQLPPYEQAKTEYKDKLTLELKEKIATTKPLLLLRAFKTEKILEVWVKNTSSEAFSLFRTYDFTGYSGQLGPKRKEGDRQIPEGFYHINRFNPKSKFHLSLGLNYPTPADLKFADPQNPGSDIFIHGSNQTVGCIPIGNEKIRELYILAEMAKQGGQKNIPVHIFPFKMTAQQLDKFGGQFPEYIQFWKELRNKSLLK